MSKQLIRICVTLLLLFLSLIFIESLQMENSDKPIKSDVIVVLTGDEGRIEKAVSLYKQGLGSYLFLTPVDLKEPNNVYQRALALGMPADKIIVDRVATSTFKSSVVTNELMDKYNMKSGIVVTSDYHLKRSKSIFERFKKDKIFFYVGAPDSKGRTWYSRPNPGFFWFSELKKNIGYKLGLYRWVDE